MSKDQENKPLSSENLASLIIKRIIEADMMKNKDASFAIEIAAEEINARKAAGDYFLDHDRAITSESLASLIVDALLDGDTIEDSVFDEAIKIAAEEIDTRKATGTY